MPEWMSRLMSDRLCISEHAGVVRKSGHVRAARCGDAATDVSGRTEFVVAAGRTSASAKHSLIARVIADATADILLRTKCLAQLLSWYDTARVRCWRRPRAAARDEILEAAAAVAARSPDETFTCGEIVAEMRARGNRYAEGTVRTHVTSRMCVNAPDHHAVTYDDFERVGDERYRFADRRRG